MQKALVQLINLRQAEIAAQIETAKVGLPLDGTYERSQQIYHDEKFLIDADGNDFVVYPQMVDPDPNEDGSGELYLHIGGESIGLKSKDGFAWLELLAEALKHVEITDID